MQIRIFLHEGGMELVSGPLFPSFPKLSLSSRDIPRPASPLSHFQNLPNHRHEKTSHVRRVRDVENWVEEEA